MYVSNNTERLLPSKAKKSDLTTTTSGRLLNTSSWECSLQWLFYKEQTMHHFTPIREIQHEEPHEFWESIWYTSIAFLIKLDKTMNCGHQLLSWSTFLWLIMEGPTNYNTSKIEINNIVCLAVFNIYIISSSTRSALWVDQQRRNQYRSFS